MSLTSSHQSRTMDELRVYCDEASSLCSVPAGNPEKIQLLSSVCRPEQPFAACRNLTPVCMALADPDVQGRDPIRQVMRLYN